MTKKNKSRKKETKFNAGSKHESGRLLYPWLTEKGVCLRTLAWGLTDQIGVETRKVLYAGIEEPETRQGCFCWLCDKPYSPSRRSGRLLFMVWQPVIEPVGVSGICVPCLDEFSTEDALWRAIYNAAPRCL